MFSRSYRVEYPENEICEGEDEYKVGENVAIRGSVAGSYQRIRNVRHLMCIRCSGFPVTIMRTSCGLLLKNLTLRLNQPEFLILQGY